ncbi:hypothetical protein KY284_010530 [Solanum tuberosum]|nr:hypothetical protein KY284_010530 [Solanum tuberosum]
MNLSPNFDKWYVYALRNTLGPSQPLPSNYRYTHAPLTNDPLIMYTCFNPNQLSYFYSTGEKSHGGDDVDDEKYFDSTDENPSQPEEEAEAASWILPTPKEGNDQIYYLFNDMDSYLDIDLMSCEQKSHILHHQQHQHGHYSSDGVVPVQNNNETSTHLPGPVVDGFPTYEIDFAGSKPYMYNFTSQSISQSVSSSSLDVGVVPDHSAMTDVSNTFVMNSSAGAGAGADADVVPNAVSGLDRETRVMRYREKRKNRKFEKTIRYSSREAYAETRHRIKGRFTKRTEIEIDSLIAADAS